MSDHITDDELDQLLARAAPQVGEFRLPAQPCEQITAQLPRHGRRSVSAGHQWHARWPYGFVAMGAVALVALVVLLAGGPRTAVQVQPASAASRILNRAADAAQQEPLLGSGQLRYTREIENQGDGRFTVETWNSSRRKHGASTGHLRWSQPRTPSGSLAGRAAVERPV